MDSNLNANTVVTDQNDGLVRLPGACARIPLSVPEIRGNEWAYIKECLDTGWVSSAGKFVDRFENEIKDYVQAGYASACVNGTAALQVALRLVGVKPGDEVIVPTVTFIAPVNAVRYLNAEPVFMDCDEYYNIDSAKCIEFLEKETVFRNGFTYNKTTGRRISAIIPVHVFGNAAWLDSLVEITSKRNIKIVEDATESLGTGYTGGAFAGKFTGTIGDIGCFSFNGNKIITAGGGGICVTDNESYARKCKYLTTQAKDDPVYSIHDEVGYNFRLTNLQAAMGVAQLESLEGIIKIKEMNFNLYKKEIDQIEGLTVAAAPQYARNNYWMYGLQVDANVYGQNRDDLISLFTQHNIEVRPLWGLIHTQKPYKECQAYAIEKAETLLERTINIPCSAGLSLHNIETLIHLLRQWKR